MTPNDPITIKTVVNVLSGSAIAALGLALAILFLLHVII